jgi:hypothetical protein
VTDINHKAVYECREFEAKIYSARAEVRKAEQGVEKARTEFQSQCAKVSGVPIESLEFSNTYCIAQGISSHVYHIKRQGQHGSPDNKCIFCGCDNYDDGM